MVGDQIFIKAMFINNVWNDNGFECAIHPNYLPSKKQNHFKIITYLIQSIIISNINSFI